MHINLSSPFKIFNRAYNLTLDKALFFVASQYIIGSIKVFTFSFHGEVEFLIPP